MQEIAALRSLGGSQRVGARSGNRTAETGVGKRKAQIAHRERPRPPHCFLGGGTDPRRMIFTARSPFSSLTHLTVTFCFSLGLPPWGCTTVSAVIAKLRTVALPNTVRVRVILSPAKAVTSPAKY